MQQSIVDFSQSILRYKISKTFIQPQIIPPIHSHQITEPMMSQLMGQSVRQLIVIILSRKSQQRQLLRKCNQTCILHRITRIISDPDHIIFLERVGLSKERLVRFHRLFSHVENKVCISFQMQKSLLLCHTISLHRNLSRSLISRNKRIRTCSKSKNVCGNQLCFREKCHLSIVSRSTQENI